MPCDDCPIPHFTTGQAWNQFMRERQEADEGLWRLSLIRDVECLGWREKACSCCVSFDDSKLKKIHNSAPCFRPCSRSRDFERRLESQRLDRDCMFLQGIEQRQIGSLAFNFCHFLGFYHKKAFSSISWWPPRTEIKDG